MNFNFKEWILFITGISSLIIFPIIGTILLTFIVCLFLYDWFIHRHSGSDIYHNISTTDNNLTKFMYMKSKYLKSQEWKDKRKLVLKRDHYKCKSCKSYNNLEVHHLSGYSDIPNEPTKSLVTLCRSCHQAWHDKHGYPKIYQDYINWNHSISTITNLDNFSKTEIFHL
jgi:5-methylcytosine-specific restriction endonuclease McrA